MNRKPNESVIIGGNDGISRRISVHVVAINNGTVTLGFDCIDVQRKEMWDSIHIETRPRPAYMNKPLELVAR